MKFADLLVSWSEPERSPRFRFLALLVGAVLFLVVFSGIVLWASSRLVELFRSLFVSPLPVTGWVLVLLGIALGLWCALVMWFAADGTPNPLAPTRRLVTHGPFRYTRNPLHLSVMIYLLGLGTAMFSFITGLVAMLFALVLGGIYHRFVEERELRARFGEEYEAYRRAAPFIVPRFTRSKQMDSE